MRNVIAWDPPQRGNRSNPGVRPTTGAGRRRVFTQCSPVVQVPVADRTGGPPRLSASDGGRSPVRDRTGKGRGVTEGARFQVVRGTRTGRRLTPAWPVVALPDGDGGTAPWFGWRLLSRNHRDLARSPLVHPTVEECLATVPLLREHAAEGSTVLTKHPTTGRWTWRLETADGVLAVSSRGYMRRRECHDCVAQVVELAPAALEASDDVVVPVRTRRTTRAATGPG